MDVCDGSGDAGAASPVSRARVCLDREPRVGDRDVECSSLAILGGVYFKSQGDGSRERMILAVSSRSVSPLLSFNLLLLLYLLQSCTRH